MSRNRAFFHGTNAELAPGDLVLPAAVHGSPPANYDPRAGTEWSSSKWASATTREHVAWDFADRAAHFASRGQQGTLPVDFSTFGKGDSYVNHPTGVQHGGTVTPEEAGVTLRPTRSPAMRGAQFEGQMKLPVTVPRGSRGKN